MTDCQEGSYTSSLAHVCIQFGSVKSVMVPCDWYWSAKIMHRVVRPAVHVQDCLTVVFMLGVCEKSLYCLDYGQYWYILLNAQLQFKTELWVYMYPFFNLTRLQE